MAGAAEADELVVAAAGADLGAGGDEQFGLGLGRDDRADVAAVEHGAARLAREIALALEQSGADARIGRDARGDAADRLALQFGIGEIDLAEVAGAHGRELALRVAAPAQQVKGDRAVEQAGVEMREVEAAGEGAGDGALAARRRSVDGDDHRLPMRRNGVFWQGPHDVLTEAGGCGRARPDPRPTVSVRPLFTF